MPIFVDTVFVDTFSALWKCNKNRHGLYMETFAKELWSIWRSFNKISSWKAQIFGFVRLKQGSKTQLKIWFQNFGASNKFRKKRPQKKQIKHERKIIGISGIFEIPGIPDICAKIPGIEIFLREMGNPNKEPPLIIYDLSVSFNPTSKSKQSEIWDITCRLN